MLRPQCPGTRRDREALVSMRVVAVLLVWISAATPLVAQGTEEFVALQADHQQWVQEELWCGLGEVSVKYQDVSLRCDEVEVDLNTLTVRAQGNVVFDQGNTRLACSRLEFDLRRKVGTLYEVEGFLPPSYYFQGAELEKLDDEHWRFHDGIFTSCTLDDTSPPWSITVRDAIMELEGYGHFRGAAMRVKGVPVFYTPRLLWPLKRDRAAGFLVPNLGYNNRHGFYFGTAFYWPVSRSLDTTLYADWLSKGYTGLGQELRWAPAENAVGAMHYYTMYDIENKRREWKVNGRHAQLFPGGYALRGEVLHLSDIDFFQRFERTFERNSLRSLYSHLTFSRTWGSQAFNLRGEHRQTFFNTSGVSSAVTLQRKPEIEYRLRSTRIGLTPFYLSLVGVADELSVVRSATLKGSYGRFDLFPSVAMFMPGFPWLNFTPAVGFRGTYYTHSYSPQQTLEPDPITRTYVTGNMSVVGPSFTRVWLTKEGTRIKHLIEPRFEYGYISDPEESVRIPVFDEKDTVFPANRIRTTFSNRLFVKTGDAGSREVATFEIFQDYSFDLPLTFARQSLPASPRGPLSFWLRTAPALTTNVDARAELDPVTHKLRGTAISGGIFHGRKNLNFTWYTSFDPISGKSMSSQTRMFAGFAPSAANWRAEAQLAYDIKQKKLLEQRYIFRWRGSCWSVFAEVRDYRIAHFETRDYRISIDLTGLGTFLDIHGGLDSLGL